MLLDGIIEEIEFDSLGAFTYSREDDTKSYDMKPQISEKLKQEREEKPNYFVGFHHHYSHAFILALYVQCRARSST